MAARIPSSVGENPAVTRGSDRSAIETFISFESLPGCPGMEWRKGLDYFTRHRKGLPCRDGVSQMGGNGNRTHDTIRVC